MQRKLTLFCNTITGDLVRVTKKDAKEAAPEWKPIQFVKNEEGVDVMRFNFDGATVDVIPNEDVEIELEPNPTPVEA